jgi:hypothetical protein
MCSELEGYSIELTFVVLAQFDDFVNIFTAESLLDNDNIALDLLAK